MSLPQNGTAVNGSPQQPLFATLPPPKTHGSTQESPQSNGSTTAIGIMNASGHANNGADTASELLRDPGASASQLSTSAQEILKRVSASTNVNAESPEWAAAREQVLKSMASSNERSVPLGRPRGRGRGRPRTKPYPIADRASTVAGSAISIPDGNLVTPVRRGRGGRPRGSRARGGRGRGGRRKRDDDTDGGPSDSDDDKSDDSNLFATTPTITKSGRSVTKPSPYNPVPQQSPTSGTKRKRPYHRKEVDQILCVRCSRGHSPPSNQIVLCDGCDSAYHQWCHDPMIDKEIAENIHSTWFCGNCQHAREVQDLPLEQRVSAAHLSLDERNAYFSTLSSKTLVSLLTHATSLHPDLPLFAPDTRAILAAKLGPTSRKNGLLPTPPASQSAFSAAQSRGQQPAINNHHNHSQGNSTSPSQRNTSSSTHTPQGLNGKTETGSAEDDPYPDYSNEDGDPPATYPRPGRGPIKLRPTTDPEDLPWMVEDNSEVFSHLVDDGTGKLVRLQNRPGPWSRSTGGAPQKIAPAPPPPVTQTPPPPHAEAGKFAQGQGGPLQWQPQYPNHNPRAAYGMERQPLQRAQQHGPPPPPGVVYSGSGVFDAMR